MTESNTARTLQKDDVSLAYEFARKFPGYTSQNIAEKGVHEVTLPHLIQPIDSTKRHQASVHGILPTNPFLASLTHRSSACSQVQARRFCLIASDHPIVSAVSSALHLDNPCQCTLCH